MLYLDLHPGCTSSAQLAESICTNPARIRSILSRLSRAGLIQAKEGRRGGGFRIASPNATLKDIAEALDVSFTDARWISGKDNSQCAIAMSMPDIMHSLYEKMDAACLEVLADIRISSLKRQILKGESK